MCMLDEHFEHLRGVCGSAAVGFTARHYGHGSVWKGLGVQGTGAVRTPSDPAADTAVYGPLVLHHRPQEMCCPS